MDSQCFSHVLRLAKIGFAAVSHLCGGNKMLDMNAKNECYAMGVVRRAIVVLILCVVSVLSAAGQGMMEATSSVNLRAGASTEYRVLDVIPRGTRVYVVETLRNGWSLVAYNGIFGYVSSRYLNDRTRHYWNIDGLQIASPVRSSSAPAGATARCVDGMYSYSKNRRGTCSHHGGVAEWL